MTPRSTPLGILESFKQPRVVTVGPGTGVEEEVEQMTAVPLEISEIRRDPMGLERW